MERGERSEAGASAPAVAPEKSIRVGTGDANAVPSARVQRFDVWMHARLMRLSAHDSIPGCRDSDQWRDSGGRPVPRSDLAESGKNRAATVVAGGVSCAPLPDGLDHAGQ